MIGQNESECEETVIEESEREREREKKMCENVKERERERERGQDSEEVRKWSESRQVNERQWWWIKNAARTFSYPSLLSLSLSLPICLVLSKTLIDSLISFFPWLSEEITCDENKRRGGKNGWETMNRRKCTREEKE